MKKNIDFGGAPPFKMGALVELKPSPTNPKRLVLTDHGDECVDEELIIPLETVEKDRVFKGTFKDLSLPGCDKRPWTVYVFRLKLNGRRRLYGVQYPSKARPAGSQLKRQSSGVWGADE